MSPESIYYYNVSPAAAKLTGVQYVGCCKKKILHSKGSPILLTMYSRICNACNRPDSVGGSAVQPTYRYTPPSVMKKIDFPHSDWYTRNKKEVIP